VKQWGDVRHRHDNPHAEKRIRELRLPRWQSMIELAAEQAEAEREAKRAAERASVPWHDLSPAELAFRWMLMHPRQYAAWAHQTREDWKARRFGVATATGAPALGVRPLP
jgi:hypothetical protein